jgi:hypothetical protein
MSVIVIFSDELPTKRREDALRFLRLYGTHLQLSELSWSVHTDAPAEYLAQRLKARLALADGVQVLPVRRRAHVIGANVLDAGTEGQAIVDPRRNVSR